ncbi:TfoX/Sxy family protein [Myxococcaceae bacterium JPH2]|nr:TfoX/Sxy family protein [Myxococcaceae bacterium JPH2]
MARQDGYVTYVVELLEPLGAVQVRHMFGGWGVYYGGRMFGLIAEGQLYLKVDELTRDAFERAGGQPFVYGGGEHPVSLGYWTPPSDAADDARELLPWARKAVDAAQRAAVKKAQAQQATADRKAAAAKKAAAKKAAAEAKPAAKKSAAKKPAAKKAATQKPAAKKVSARRARA